MRILLTGHGSCRNRGCEAIVRGTVRILRESLPQSEIVLQSSAPEYDKPYGCENRMELNGIIPYERDETPRWSRGWLSRRVSQRARCKGITVDAYLNMDVYRTYDVVVVSVGGDNFSDDYGSPRFYFDSLVAARRAGAKTVIWGASIGPFRNDGEARRWKAVLDQVDLITVREPTTVEYLKSLGVSRNVCEVSDPAFVMPSERPRIDPLPPKDGGILVGLGISALVANRRTLQDYVTTNVEFIRYAVSSYRAQICLVPHVFALGGTKENNDLAVCGEVAALLPKSHPVTILPPSLNACEIKHCISQCDYFIGARTHSTIASLSTYVPTISIGYSVKASGINKAVFGTEEYVVPMKELNRDGLIGCFDRLQANKSTVRQRLQTTVPLLCSAARRAGEYLHEVVG